jgi:5'-3' exoribonuclease 2
MKKTTSLVLFLAVALVIAGCESTGPKTKTGAVAGGLIGATAGGIIGHQSGHGLEGAGIGAAIGAIGGALVGSAMDQKDKEALAVNPNHITLTKIAEMASQGTPDAVIISEIDRTHSVYNLNSEIITYLKQNKVSDKVIDYMMATAK